MNVLKHLTSPDAAAVIDGGAALLVIPLGATEQHGPHLPLSTDTAIACALARGLAAAEPRAVLAPPLAYGASGEHQAFPGTISIGQRALRSILVELVRSATAAFSRVLLLNAHGGNASTVAGVVAQLRDEGRDVRAWNPAAIWQGDAHAGEVETSLMLSLHPDSVRVSLAVAGNTEPLAELMPTLISSGVRAVSENGILGDPSGANRQHGDELLASAVGSLTDYVDAWLTPRERT